MKVEHGKIMHTSQWYIDQVQSKNDIMNNWERTSEFGFVHGKCFWEQCTSRFEFITIIAEKVPL